MSWWLLVGVGLLSFCCSRRESGVVSAARGSAGPPTRTLASASPSAWSSAPSSPSSAVPRTTEMQLRPLRSGLSVARGLHADSSGTLHEWRLARVDLTRFRLRVQALPARTLGDVVGERSVPMAVNGGFFNHDFSPSGLLLSRGKRIAPVRRGGGSGILVVRNARAELVARDDALPDDVDFAMQCGPRLIERDGSVGIHRDDGKRAARTVACIREHGEVLDLIVVFTPESIGDGPTLFQLAERLSKPLAASDTTGCAAALNLDGGPSTGMVVVEAPELRYDPIGPVPFALAVEATTSSE